MLSAIRLTSLLDSEELQHSDYPVVTDLGLIESTGHASLHGLVRQRRTNGDRPAGALRLAAVGNYRIGVYEEDDSEALEGMGDRDSTFMLGLGLQAELPELAVVPHHLTESRN